MKLAFTLVIGLTCAALIGAAPSPSGGIRDHVKGLIDLFKGQAIRKIEELRQQKEELMDKLREARGVAEEEVKKKIDELSSDMQRTYQDLLRKLKDIFSKDDQQSDYFKDALMEKIRELRGKLAVQAAEFSAFLKELAAQTSNTARDHMREQGEIIAKELQRIRYELLSKLVELLQREQKQETYGLQSDVLDTLRQKAAEIKQKAAELRDQMKTTVGEKRAVLLQGLRELQAELRGIMSDIVTAVREMMGRQTQPIEDEDNTYFIDTFKELRKQINMKLDALKTLVDLAKIATGQAKDEIKKAIDTLKVEIPLLRDDLLREIKKMFDTADQVNNQ